MIKLSAPKKTLFVAGQGVDDINDALSGSLTYQPAEPTEDLDILVFSETEEDTDTITGSFVIDESIGRNTTLQVDFGNREEVRTPVQEYKIFVAKPVPIALFRCKTFAWWTLPGPTWEGTPPPRTPPSPCTRRSSVTWSRASTSSSSCSAGP